MVIEERLKALEFVRKTIEKYKNGHNRTIDDIHFWFGYGLEEILKKVQMQLKLTDTELGKIDGLIEYVNKRQ